MLTEEIAVPEEATEDISATGTSNLVVIRAGAGEVQHTSTTENETMIYQFTVGMDEAFYSLDIANVLQNGNIEVGLYTTTYIAEHNAVKYYSGTTPYSLHNHTLLGGNSKGYNLGKLTKGATYYLTITYEEAGAMSAVSINKKTDNLNDEVTGALALALDGKATAGFNDNDLDVDYYTFTTDESNSYYGMKLNHLSARNSITYGVYSDPSCGNTYLVKSYSGTYASNAGGDLYGEASCTLDFDKLEKKKTYYVKIWNKYFKENGRFNLAITQTEDDLGDTASAAKSLKLNETHTGSADNVRDEDYYAFKTTKTSSFYKLTVSNIAKKDIVRYKVYTDKQCTKLVKFYLGSSDFNADGYVTSKRSETINLGKLAANHTYYIKMTSDCTDLQVNGFKLKVSRTADDIKDTAGSAKTLTLNKTYNYTLQNEQDVDVYKFVTTGYENYTFSFANISSSNDVQFTVYSGRDFLQNQIVLDKRLSKKQSLSNTEKTKKLSTRTRTYYVVVKSNGYTTGKYRIGVYASSPSGAKTVAANTKKTKKVKLSWKQVNKATGYVVERADSKNGKFVKLKTVSGTKKVSYTDSKKLKKGKTYYYRVKAYRKVGKKTYYSGYSSVKSIKIK